jgi:hypothetical protein
VADRERDNRPEPNPTPRGRRGVPGRIVVKVVLSAAALTAAVVCWFAFANRDTNKPMMNLPEIGAGAGHTGMSNEYGGIGKKPAAKP